MIVLNYMVKYLCSVNYSMKHLRGFNYSTIFAQCNAYYLHLPPSKIQSDVII